MASPTNRVRVMVEAASGCCASELKAVATARPSPSAGPTLPMAIVRPAVTIEATAMMVMLSIMISFGSFVIVSSFLRWFGFGLARADGSRNVNCGQNAEDVGLHNAREQTEQSHEDRKDEGRDGQQNRDDHRPAHHVAEQADGQSQRA